MQNWTKLLCSKTLDDFYVNHKNIHIYFYSIFSLQFKIRTNNLRVCCKLIYFFINRRSKFHWTGGICATQIRTILKYRLLKIYDLVCCIILKKIEGLQFFSENFFFLTMDTLTLFNSRENIWFIAYYVCAYSSCWARFACRGSVVMKIKVDSELNLLLLCKYVVANIFCLCGIGRIIGIGFEIIIY